MGSRKSGVGRGHGLGGRGVNARMRFMRRTLFFFLLFLPTIAFADWQQYPNQGCIGGSKCPDRSLRVKLEDRPVTAIRFHAHDSVGETAGGKLRVRIDGNTLRGSIDIPRAGEMFTIDVDQLTGQYLILEPDENDEVVIDQIAVNYSSGNLRPLPRKFDDRDRDRGGSSSSGGGWKSYARDAQCIGGTQCRQNGNRITIALDSEPVLGIRFRAHDNIGNRAEGLLNVRIDDQAIASYVDVKRDGMRHELDVDRVRGSRLVISTANDDEVEVSNIEVLYARDRGRGEGGSGGGRETTHEGACIGGSQCGGSRARIRVRLRERAVVEIRFYARDDVGSRAGGELRIRIDDEIVRDNLDIPREGRTFTIDAHGLEGEWLIIEPAEDDEVVVKDIRVKYE